MLITFYFLLSTFNFLLYLCNTFLIMDILIIDNYDSFTYNLVHYLEEIDCNVEVVRNDQIDLQDIEKYSAIVLSPGPGLPKDAGKLMEVIGKFHQTKPILGVCLGMQALAEYFGGSLYNQQEVKHGVSEKCKQIYPNKLFTNLNEHFDVGLYHSWAIDIEDVKCFHVTAISENKVLMAIEHQSLPIVGVQFHPESILTPNGKEMILNFITKFC